MLFNARSEAQMKLSAGVHFHGTISHPDIPSEIRVNCEIQSGRKGEFQVRKKTGEKTSRETRARENNSGETTD
jgi:hypothetical protein